MSDYRAHADEPESDAAPMRLDLDRTTVAFLVMLRGALKHEPERPDSDKHDGHALAEVALRHFDWERQCQALRMLIGVRVVNAALDQYGP